jgi:hypothetical protein
MGEYRSTASGWSKARAAHATFLPRGIAGRRGLEANFGNHPKVALFMFAVVARNQLPARSGSTKKLSDLPFWFVRWMLSWCADLHHNPSGRRMIETESRVTAPLQNPRSRRLVSSAFHPLIRGVHLLLILNNESDVKKRWVGRMHRVFAMHQDQNETVRSLEYREPAIAAPFGYLEIQAALEKISETWNIADSHIYVIEFQHFSSP